MNPDIGFEVTNDEAKGLFEKAVGIINKYYLDLGFNDASKWHINESAGLELQLLQYFITCQSYWKNTGEIDDERFIENIRIATQAIYLIGQLSTIGSVEVRETNDWSALYINGRRALEGHTLYWAHVLDTLGIAYNRADVELPSDFTDETHYIHFADHLEDIVVSKYIEGSEED